MSVPIAARTRHLLLWAIALAASASAAGEPAPAVHEWPQWHGDAGNTCVSNDPAVRPPFKLVWSYRLDSDGSGDAGSGVIAAGGLVYAYSYSTGTFVALDAETGELRWEFGAPDLSYSSVPAYENGRLFLTRNAHGRRGVVALEAKTAKVLWKKDFSGSGVHVSRWGMPVADGRLYIHEGGKEPAVVCVAAENGEELWRRALGNEDGHCAVAPTVAGGRVFVAMRTGYMPSHSDVGATWALDAKSGEILWKRKSVFPLRPMSADERIVVCPMYWSKDQQLHVLDAKTGETLFAQKNNGVCGPLSSDRIYIKPGGGAILGLDRTEGKKVLGASAPAGTGCSVPVINGNYAYVGTGCPGPSDSERPGAFGQADMDQRTKGSGWSIHALDLSTGKSVWSFSTACNVCGDPAIAYGKLYCNSRDGRVYCFAPCKESEPTTPEAIDTAEPASPEAVKALLAAEVAEYEPNNAWPMAGGSAARNGIEGQTLAANLEPAWTYEIGGRVLAGAAIASGTVYSGSDGGTLHAVDLATGTKKWTYDAKVKVRVTPAVAGDSVYAGADDGTFFALDAKTGAAEWTFRAGGAVSASPVVAGGVVLFGAADHNLYALDRSNGKKLWSFRADSYLLKAPPAVRGDTVYAAAWLEWLYAIDLATGRLKWKTYHAVSVEAVALHREKVYARTPYYLMEIDPADGKRLRMAGAGYGYGGMAFDKNLVFVTGIASQYGSSAARAFDLDAPDMEGKGIGASEPIRVISAGKGYPGGVDGMTTPVALDGKTVFTKRNGTIVLLDRDGKMLWSAKMGGQSHADPAVAGGVLVVGCDDGKLYAFRAKQ
ncbi:MAG: PQQ-binding-like beta-propeller repeat protein [Planctomycetes bacterium]|nr:PQQ-binding-like beta-propeller repeat protein [Planctomycetota bacterium]